MMIIWTVDYIEGVKYRSMHTMMLNISREISWSESLSPVVDL